MKHELQLCWIVFVLLIKQHVNQPQFDVVVLLSSNNLMFVLVL